MPFLFLGLLNDDGQVSSKRNSAPEPARDGGLKLSEQFRTDDETRIPPSASRVLPPVQVEKVTTPTDDSGGQVSTLSLQLEELRRKLSGGKESQPQVFRVVNDGIPTFGTFKFGYLPGRGLLYSAIAHEVALFGLFLLFTYGLPAARPQKLIVRMNSQDHIVYLPEVGGGSEGQKSPGGGKSAPQEPSAAPARASKGFAYPGPQTILSDPPNPTNAFQTIQRPLLVHPETVRKLVPLPNIVQMSETRLPSDLVAPRPVLPQHLEVPKALRVKQDSTTHRQAKWKIPVTDAPKLEAKAEMPKLPAAEEPLPEAPKVEPQVKREEEQKRESETPSPRPIKVTAEKRTEKSDKQAAPPSPAQIARMEMHGKEKEPLLALSPMPLPPGANVKVPTGEARGRFAIAPGGTLNPNSITPGKPSAAPSVPAGTGQERLQAANAAADSNSGTGAGRNPSAGGGSGTTKGGTGEGSAGTGTGSGNTAGPGAGGAGSGRGRGNKGSGAGTSGGRGNGTGSGAGSGSGTGAFPGITIQGGEEANANQGKTPGFTVEPQTTYGMTIVSTASSGGGLEDFGVFENERIFTVYIPMKRGPDEEDPTWTLQYAVLKDDPATSVDGQVSAPTPVAREWPQVPADLEKRYAQAQVVLYAVVDKEGKVSRVSVKQTPDPRVSAPIAQAFAKWLFRPALVNGQPVAVKVLLGIPL